MKTLTAFLILGFICFGTAKVAQAFPFWLNSPTGRNNPNDPRNPSYKPTSVPAYSPAVGSCVGEYAGTEVGL